MTLEEKVKKKRWARIKTDIIFELNHKLNDFRTIHEGKLRSYEGKSLEILVRDSIAGRGLRFVDF